MEKIQIQDKGVKRSQITNPHKKIALKCKYYYELMKNVR